MRNANLIEPVAGGREAEGAVEVFQVRLRVENKPAVPRGLRIRDRGVNHLPPVAATSERLANGEPFQLSHDVSVVLYLTPPGGRDGFSPSTLPIRWRLVASCASHSSSGGHDCSSTKTSCRTDFALCHSLLLVTTRMLAQGAGQSDMARGMR